MGQIASAAHAPFIAGAAPGILGINSWEDINEPRDLAKVMEGPEWLSWNGFRKSEDSRYVSLALPRFLSRLPYGKENPVEGLAGFRETCEGGDHSKYTWSNAAYALATNITQAHAFYGWTACIRGKNSGGGVTGLHVHTFPTADGGTEMKCPTEVSIPFRRDHELAKLGLASLLHWKGTDEAAFLSVPSVFNPPEFYEAESTANAKLNGSIPYLMVVSRFSHFLNKMLHDAVGSFHEKETLEKWLNDWITNFVLLDGQGTDEQKAKRPLSSAKVTVEEVDGQPGYYNAVFLLRPHYQLEGVNTSLRLVSGKKFALK
jgi:type VI secretion system protein ImpC